MESLRRMLCLKLKKKSTKRNVSRWQREGMGEGVGYVRMCVGWVLGEGGRKVFKFVFEGKGRIQDFYFIIKLYLGLLLYHCLF